MWFRRKVQSGNKIGRKLGHPTLNFHVGSFADHHKPGVYACQVKIGQKLYTGALYFGPKMNHKNHALELFVIDFAKQIYGHFVSFKIGKKIRGPKKFDSLDELKKQIQIDLKSIV